MRPAPFDRRRLRWLVRCLAAIDAASPACRLSIRAIRARLADRATTAAESDALLDTLGGLILDTLDVAQEP